MIETNNKMAIFVTSFDGYSDIWDSFFKIFSKYWNNCSYKIYLSSNYKDYSYPNTVILKVGNEISWQDRMLKCLNEIEEEYVLIFLEDYFLGTYVNNIDIDNILDFVIKNGVDMYRIADIPKTSKVKNTNSNVTEIFKDKRYSVNFQSAIWRKKHLIDIISKLDNNTCWDFEYYFLKIASTAKHEPYINYFADNRDIFEIKNGVLKGKWLPDTIKYFDKRGIKLVLNDREVLSYYSFYRYKIVCFVASIVPRKLNNYIKKILKIFKITFLSDI